MSPVSTDTHIHIYRSRIDARAGARRYIETTRRNIDLHYTSERASISVGTEAPRLLEFFFLTAMISGSSESCARHVDRPIGRRTKSTSWNRRSLEGASNSPRSRRVPPASIAIIAFGDASSGLEENSRRPTQENPRTSQLIVIRKEYI